MAQISHKCPYCGTEKAGFEGTSFTERLPGGQIFNLFMRCWVCGESIIAQFRADHVGIFNQWLQTKNAPVDLMRVFPEPIEAKYPDNLPDNVLRYYKQAIDGFGRQNWDSAGMMFRKSLDSSLKTIARDLKGTLQKRIDDLPDDIGVTPAMKVWAHEIRVLGNDAAHEDDPFTEADAKDLQSFTELFVTYVFTMPAKLRARHPQPAPQA